MRISSSVTSLSWVPSEAVTGPINPAMFASGSTHHDEPLPVHVDDLDALREADAFRFANRLSAWAEVADGRIVAAGHTGGGSMGATTVRIGKHSATFAAVSLPDLRNEPILGGTSVRFVQTAGGRTALPAPRRVAHPPFVKWEAPTVWTTLELVIHADGRVERNLIGASSFPRHWVHDDHGDLFAEAGMTSFDEWYRHSFGPHTPWGERDTPALVTVVGSALERRLSTEIVGGDRPEIRTLDAGAALTRQGPGAGGEVHLLLDGVVVEVDGEPVAEVGPGAILGERASFVDCRRTSTLRARTRIRVAVTTEERLDRTALATVAAGHRREVA
jgi:hypothetical protein